jgi:Tfp pilus assembly protein FimT
MPRNRQTALGFSLIDLMMAVAVGAIVLAVAVPSASRTVNALRLNAATRDLERELQFARLKAVSLNRAMRVRFNCPVAGQYRTVEVMGNATVDNPLARCSLTNYPYPGPLDSDPATPSADGPLRIMHPTMTVNTLDVQFSPRGTASTVASGTVSAITTPVYLVAMRADNMAIVGNHAGNTGSIEINALGKIKIY